MSDEWPKGRPLAQDPEAESADPELSAFIARPQGAPVYHGFPVLEDVEIDGFKLGKITDWELEPDVEGDAFVVAPDGSRAGLMWDVTEEDHFEEVSPPEEHRGGVWAVGFPHEMRTREDAQRNLAHLVPKLREKWEEWRRS